MHAGRLRGALQVATEVQEPVEALTGSAFLERELAEPVEGVLTVVWHSVVWQYLAPAERERVTALLAAASARATPAAPLAHLALEPQRVGDGHYDFQVRLTTWPGGGTRVLADCEGHGPPVRWR